jgi:predicted ATPase
MAGKLKRFSAPAQEALKQLACLGNVTEIATLTVVQEENARTVHEALWEAVHAGLVVRQSSAYKFLHDRIQQAAYSLIPEEQRAGAHLRIGRVLLSNIMPDQLAEHLFDVANQFNRGAALLVDPDEKGKGVHGVRLGVHLPLYGNDLDRSSGLDFPLRARVQPLARARGVRIPQWES